MSQTVPQPNGSLLLAWQVKNRHVLLIGGGEVATGRVNLLLQANAKITLVSPQVTPEIEEWDKLGLIHKIHLREYVPADLKMYEVTQMDKLAFTPTSESDFEKIEEVIKNEKFALVLTAIPDHNLSRVIHYQAKLNNLQCNIADRPQICDFYFGAMYRKGPLQIMISSNGNSPRLTRRIKDEKIAKALEDVDLEKAVENLGYLRGKLRTVKAVGDTNEIIKQRMDWNKKTTDIYSIEDWCQFTKDQLDHILDFYPELPPSSEL